MSQTILFRKFIFSIAILLFHINLNAQVTIEGPQYFYGCAGDMVIIMPEINPDFITPNTLYTWTDPSGFTVGQSNIPYIISMAGFFDAGQYTLAISDDGISVAIYNNLQFQLFETDASGGKVFPDQIIVEYIDGISQAFKDSLRMEFQADLIDMCVCGTLELWQLIPNDLIIVLPSTIPLININSKIESLRMNVKSKEVDRNRPVEGNNTTDNNLALTGHNKITWEDIPPPLFLDNCDTIVVAVIDNGIDYNHDGIESIFSYNELEALNPNSDTNNNCLTADSIGWDFSDNDADPISLISGHGTHVAGIIDTTFHNYNTTSTVLEIMPIRTLDDNGDGDLFDLICGVLYAKNQQVNIINMSLGWQGDSSLILSAALDNEDSECGFLFVASAGNESTNNDDLKHYPGGYILENIIEVASIDSIINGDLVVFNSTPAEPHYTNYGESVDLAARGYWVSTLVGNAHGVKEGTSMSSGYITGILAAMKAAEPHATPAVLREVLLTEAAQPVSNLDTLVNEGRIVFPFLIPNAVSAMQKVQTTPCGCPPVGLKEVFTNNKKSSWLRAYPNPSNGEVHLDFTLERIGQAALSVFNGHGQVLDKQQFNLSSGKQEVIWSKVTGMPKGIYFFQIMTATELFVGKVFMQ
ncbi:MAG: hypothetical protein ACJAYJ_003084 [Saprospiraceae bacterium]|jgi:hypothetical protein